MRGGAEDESEGEGDEGADGTDDERKGAARPTMVASKRADRPRASPDAGACGAGVARIGLEIVPPTTSGGEAAAGAGAGGGGGEPGGGSGRATSGLAGYWLAFSASASFCNGVVGFFTVGVKGFQGI